MLKSGPRRISPFFIPAAIINLASGWVSIRTGAKGPNSATATACATSGHAIGDSLPAHPARRRRRDDRRRQRGRHHCPRPRRVLLDARRLHPQRRARESVAALRPRPRRLRHGRGRRHRRPRGARARPGARRPHLRRDRRLRHEQRRLPHLDARRERRRHHPRDEGGAQGRRGGAGADRLHQRARHLDAVGRPHRDPVGEGRVRRRTRASSRSARPSR